MNKFDEYFVLEGKARTREEAISEAGSILLQNGKVQLEYVESMFERESSVSTYMGNFLAIPHGTV
jgi:PTS system mannitol-specific IIA component